MRTFSCTFCALVLGLLSQSATSAPIKYYATKYDHIDLDAILNNRRMVNYYASCLLSQGPCPPEGVELKRILPEALQTNCARCTEKQKTVALRSIKRLRKEYPKIWSQLAAKWDPDEAYFRKFEASFGSRLPPQPSTQPPPLPPPITSKPLTTAPPSTTTTTTTTTTTPAPPISTTSTSTTVTLANRFDDFDNNNNVEGGLPYAPAVPFSTKKPPNKVTNKATNPPLFTSPTSTTPKPTTKPRPTANVGVNLQSTVSLVGTNIVNGIVRGLGTLGQLGTQVVETGVQIADVVLKGVQRVVRPF